MKTKLSVAIASLLTLSVSVQADTEQLATIVVEGSASRPGSFSLAPDSSGLKDAAALLERVPGANINRNGPLTGVPQYRGMYGNRVNVTVDGVSLKEAGPNSMDTPLTHVPASLIDSMTVYRGIAPVSSGIETVGGTMKVKLKKGHFADTKDEIESDGVVSSGYSSVDNGYFVSGFTSLANQNHKIHIGASKEEGNSYKYKERSGKQVLPTQYNRRAVTVGYDYQRNGHEFGLNYSNNKTINTGSPALPMDIISIKGNLYDAKYNWDFGQGYQLKTKFFYQSTDHLMNNHSLRKVMIQNGKPKLMDNTTSVQAGGWDFAFLMPLFSGTLTTGFNGDTAHNNSVIQMNAAMVPGGMPMDMVTNNFNDTTRSRYSLYGEWKGDIADKLSTELGMRLTYINSDTGNVSTGSMALKPLAAQFNAQNHNKDFINLDLVAMLRYAMRSDLDLEIGFARKNRGPSYQSLYLWSPLQATGGLADGRTYVGNLNLQSETAYQFELGMDWHTDQAYFSPRAFYHYVDHYIQGGASGTLTGIQPNCPTTAACPVLQYENINAQLYGVDLDAGYVLTDWLSFDGGLNYVRGQNLSNGGNLYRIAPLNGRTQLTFNYEAFKTSIEGVYYAAQNNVATYNNEHTTKAYQIMNLRASYEPVEGLFVGTGIENVLDSTNRNHLGGYYAPINDVKNGLNRGQRIPLQGRNYYVTLSYKW